MIALRCYVFLPLISPLPTSKLVCSAQNGLVLTFPACLVLAGASQLEKMQLGTPSKAGEEMTKAGLAVQDILLIRTFPVGPRQKKPHWH